MPDLIKPALKAFLPFIIFVALYDDARAYTYLWPLEGYRALTGTFGEFRGTHFHTGIDISTHGINGIPLQAVDDGFVYRVKTSPRGYGRALYLRLRDGNIVVYAHLSRFTSPVTQRVREEQHRLSDYTIDYFPPAQDFPVKRGDIIGYSGDTGGVSPHLHFELRTPENHPVNPLPYIGIVPIDTSEPEITAVALSPIGIDSTVEENWETRTYSTQWNQKLNAYTIPQPIRIWGSFGVEICAHDLSPRGYHTGVYSLDLFLNNQPISALRYDTVTYDEYRENFVVVNRRLYIQQNKQFQRFYYRGGTPALPFYHIKGGTSGLLTSFPSASPYSLEPGLNNVTIVAEDHAKKQSTLLLQLIVEEPFYQKPAVLSPGVMDSTLNDTSADEAITSRTLLFDDFLVVEATVPIPHPASVQCFFRQPGTEETAVPLHLRPPGTLVGRHTLLPHHDGVASLRFKAVFSSGTERENTHELLLQTVSPDKGGVVTSTDGVVSIALNPGSVPQTIFPQVTQGPVAAPPPYLKPESLSYQFKPLEVTFRDKGTITMRLTEKHSRQIALFYRDKGNWRFLARTKDPGRKEIVSSIPYFAEYALFRDVYPPSISIDSPAENAVLKKPVKPFSARVDDQGTGIDSHATVLFLNGKKVPAEYIANKKQLVYEPLHPLEPGEYTLQVVALDLVKNRTEASVTFRVVE